MATEGSFSGDLSKDLSFFLNASFDSVSGQFKSSTPQKKGKKSVASSQFKVPTKKAPQQSAVVGTCDRCGKQYRTVRNFKKHMQGHALQDIANRTPDMASIKENSFVIGDATLQRMLSHPSVGLHAEKFSMLLQSVIQLNDEQNSTWHEFLSSMIELFSAMIATNFSLPSVLSTKSLQLADDVLTSVETRNILLGKLKNCAKDFSDTVYNSFLCEFVFTFADQLVIFICRLLRKAGEASSRPIVNFDDEERQCIFYIGGSIFHGFKKMAYKHNKNKKWKSIYEVMQSHVLEGKSSSDFSEQEKKDRNWTDVKSRGGLLFIKGRVLEFLLSVAQIVASSEQIDGSLPVDKILTEVVSGKPKWDWDIIVGSALEEDLSFSLLVGIVRSFISTYGKGVIKRRLNKLYQNKAGVSVTLRHKVAPR